MSALLARSAPANEADTVGSLAFGSEVTLLRESDDGLWFEVDHPKFEGVRVWMSAALITPDATCAGTLRTGN